MFRSCRSLAPSVLRGIRAFAPSARTRAVCYVTPKFNFAPMFESNKQFYCSQQVQEKKEETSSETTAEKNPEYKNIISSDEKTVGSSERMEFKAETKKLLDIVAKSLYSEREVFIRELVSNASDAIEKLRFYSVTRGNDITDPGLDMEIHIKTDDEKKQFIIQDTGIGMTKDEVQDCLGTIAKSGSKAFMEELSTAENATSKNIIGTFGVGFYSAFMVGDRVEVFTKSYLPSSKGIKWSSPGLGDYEIREAENVKRGTKVVINLRGDAYDFSKETFVKDIIVKYSNFVGVPIYLNGQKINAVEAIWLKSAKEISQETHEAFYKFISGNMDIPRYTYQINTDAPLNIRALFYVPEGKPNMLEMSREADVGVSLYSRRVLINPKANNVMPKWLRFVKGVVDSEDIPLNLSRELLQDGNLIRKLRHVIQSKLIKFFQDQRKKDTDKFATFYGDYSVFFKEGIVTTSEQNVREDIAELLMFESSKNPAGTRTTLREYCSRMKAGARQINYFAAPSRAIAESSPYFEAFVTGDDADEVLICTDPFDEVVLMQLAQYSGKNLVSIENETTKPATAPRSENESGKPVVPDEAALHTWLKDKLGDKIHAVRSTAKLVSYPCVITVPEMSSTRHFVRTMLHDRPEHEKLRLLQPTLEINPSHPLVVKLDALRVSENPDDVALATDITSTLYTNAMLSAGLVDDTRSALPQLNELLTKLMSRI